MNERIFISYKRADKERVFALKDSIEQATGEKCWIDLDGIESDAQFVDVIMNSIDNCEVFLFMRSKEHNKIANHRTDWTIREVNYALGEKKRIVFVALDNSPLPRWFKFMFPNQQEIDATDGAKLKGLHADLRSWLGIQPKMDNVLRAHFFTKKSNVNMHNGHEFVDLGLSVKWATCNIGASKSDDYGDYFAWGETQTKSIYDWRGYKWCKNNYTNIIKYNCNCSYGMLDYRKQLEISDDAANVILGGKWRIPTYEEFLELKEKCTWRWITQNGVNGYKIIGPNKNSIFLPAAGYRSEQLLYSLGYNGDYWLSLLDTAFSGGAWGARIASKEVRITSLDRYYGRSIRPVFS